MNKTTKKRALSPQYVSPNQLVMDGFETPLLVTFIQILLKILSILK